MPISRKDYEQKIYAPVNYAFLKWRIKDFHLWPVEVNEAIQSKTISCCSNSWIIEVRPKFRDENFQDHIGIHVRNTLRNKRQVKARIKVYLKNCKSQIQSASEEEFVFNSADEGYGWPYFARTWEVLEEKKEQLYPDNVLTVCCEISLISDITYGEIKLCQKDELREENAQEESETSFDSYDTTWGLYATILNAQKYCDLRIKIRDQIIPVHKAVLSAYSPIFAKKFNLMAFGSILEMDIDLPLFVDFLYFVYTGLLRNTSIETAHIYLSFAELYEVEDLKSSVGEYLSRIVSLDNFARMVEIAARIRDQHLLKAIKAVFFVDFEKIIFSNDWYDLVRKYPIIVAQMKAELRMSFQN